MWKLQRNDDGKIIFVKDGKISGEVVHMRPGKEHSTIKFKLLDDQVLKESLKQLENGDKTTRSSFFDQWNTANKDKENAKPSDVSSASDTSYNSEHADNDLSLGLQDKCQGIVDVHISNLVTPDPSRCTRLLDHQHVAVLKESFIKNNYGQLVVFMGYSSNTRVDDLTREGGAKVEVLGGNHTREALQSLHAEARTEPLVKVRLYSGLTRLEALRIGYQHNMVIHEKKKPMGFFDKVRLMKTCKDVNMTNKEWKEKLCTLFQIINPRKFQQAYNHHMLMAGLPDEVFNLAVEASHDLCITDKFFKDLMRLSDMKAIQECLGVLNTDGISAFKPMVKNLISEGGVRSNQRKRKVADCDGKVLVSTQEHCVEVTDGKDVDEFPTLEPSFELHASAVSLQSEDFWKLKYEDLLEKYNALAEERTRQMVLVENTTTSVHCESMEFDPKITSTPSLTPVPIQEAPKRNERKVIKKGAQDKIEIFKKGDEIKAFWRHEGGEEEWLDATVITTYTDGSYKVKYHCDQQTSKLRPSWVKRK